MENKEERIVEEAVELEPKVEEENVVPEGTGEVAPAEVVEEPKDEVKTEDKPEAVSEEAEEPQTEDKPEELEQKPEEETVHSDGDNDNKEDKKDGEEPAEVVKPEDEVTYEEPPTPTQEELMAQLEELRAEKEEQEALRVCNEQVMKVEQEFQVCSDRIAQALKESFAQNGIDASKTIEELKAEDPAKATLAMQFISQAQDLKAQLEQAAVKEISKHQNEVIYRAASREFEKMDLNLEQAKDAVKTFKRIVNEIGIADLDEDLKMKVQLAAGRAKIVVPSKEVEPDKVAEVADDVDTTELKEPSPEIEKEEKVVEDKEEKEVPPPEEKEPEPVVEKPSVEDFEEGVAGQASVGAGTIITELNVLEELNKLPFKERTKFYKEHEDVITKAMLKRK